ncbi:MAG TPA: acyloxyacyl hydrolase [Candidatus Binataceae bacterium]|nr:acyloxyacyl hydrolase [Candidatus Binataceae bacterium]
MKARRLLVALVAFGFMTAGYAFAQAPPATNSVANSQGAAQDPPAANSIERTQTAAQTESARDAADFNRQIYYRNKLEAGFDVGYYPWNIPFVFDPLIGQCCRRAKGTTDYSLIPLTLQLRWHLTDIHGRSFWRGNTEFDIGGSYTSIAQGPESYYGAMLIGLRYNFVQPDWKFVPYTDVHGGFGWTNAQQPYEQAHHQRWVGQGQDFTFTFMWGIGVRYNFNPRISLSAGIAYMHISNAYLSEPKYINHGINNVGPNWGLNFAL